MKSLYKSLTAWLLCLVFVFSSFIVSFADAKSLMIGSSSNALMTLDLNDDDYAIMPFSSLGSVTNTVTVNDIDIIGYYMKDGDDEGVIFENRVKPELISNKFRFALPSLPMGSFYYGFSVVLYSDALPSAGTYNLSFDYASNFSFDVSRFYIRSYKRYLNASQVNNTLNPPYDSLSGDLYMRPYKINLTNLYSMVFAFNVSGENQRNIDGDIAINFTVVESDDSAPSTAGSNTSDADYQDDVSSSLSDLSSSVDTMTDEISGVTEAIQTLQGAMEPHYSNVLTQLHHITEQLHAFYDQVYNNIHLAQMNMLGQIKEAIENIDLEVNISLDGLKQTIQQVGQNVITNDNKISADQIANDETNTEEVKDAVKEHGNFIIDGLKGLFIPSDEFFKAYFDDLYAYFSDRFGFLSFPIDLLVRTVNLFINSSDVDAVLTLPSFEISGEQVWADQSFNFTEFMETNFAFLLAAIRTVTSIGMIYAFVNLCQDKWDEVMKN